jgi:hypothetical protein
VQSPLVEDGIALRIREVQEHGRGRPLDAPQRPECFDPLALAARRAQRDARLALDKLSAVLGDERSATGGLPPADLAEFVELVVAAVTGSTTDDQGVVIGCGRIAGGVLRYSLDRELQGELRIGGTVVGPRLGSGRRP